MVGPFIQGEPKGMVSEPDRNSTTLSPTCISAHHGLQKPKFRLINDLPKSNVSNTAQTPETHCPQYLDSFVALARSQQSNGAVVLEQWWVDFSRAYKTIALRPSSGETALFVPRTRLSSYNCITTHPFGSRSNRASVTMLLEFLRCVLLLVLGAYVDDVPPPRRTI